MKLMVTTASTWLSGKMLHDLKAFHSFVITSAQTIVLSNLVVPKQKHGCRGHSDKGRHQEELGPSLDGRIYEQIAVVIGAELPQQTLELFGTVLQGSRHPHEER